ncbi:MAG: malto-oligosyltrehalose synthase [Nitrospirales bacterium]
MASPRIPFATYRLQFNRAFTFADTTRIIPYLHELGITDIYASPYLKALPGSTHGYDIIDPTCLNPDLGTEEDYHRMIETLRSYDMGQILDVVPNHMGIDASANLWWQDVLENGPASHYAHYFDIDWTPVKDELENKVLLPILGDQYGIVLENQEILLQYEEGRLFLRYYDHIFPLDPCTWIQVLGFRQEILLQQFGDTDPHLQEYLSILTALTHLPGRTETDADRIAERYREKEVIRRRLLLILTENSRLQSFLLESLHIINGAKGNARSFDVLDTLVSSQAYRLAYWRVAAEEINYRRFFDINQLAAIRMEQPGVFQEANQKIFDLLTTEAVTGLRIDHVDGLSDPKGYLTDWQKWGREHLTGFSHESEKALYVIVEKILGSREPLNADWPIHGTTGYDFLTWVNQVFVDTRHERSFNQLYAGFTKYTIPFEDLIYQCKKLIMSSSMSGEINSLGHQLNVLSERNRRSRDFTLNSLIHAIREIIACFPVYRTYISPAVDEPPLDRDRVYIRLAVDRAIQRNPALSDLVFEFIRDLLLKSPEELSGLDWESLRPFVLKFQQTTSPVTAKGVEDTAFYIFNRLTSLNEVGGEPQHFGISMEDFHHLMRERANQWPHSLSTTSTHDTKRSEDVRARLNVLSEIPKEWRQRLRLWSRLNKKAKQILEEKLVPSANEEYLIYQTLLGIWPVNPLQEDTRSHFLERMNTYILKALKEAKENSSWLNPDETYESAVLSFLNRILDMSSDNKFFQDFLSFQSRIALYGIYNSLSQVLLKITAPGIPDFYQGTELWDFTLVDPDNRHPIDYATHQQLFDRLQVRLRGENRSTLLAQLLKSPEDGVLKLFLTAETLKFRNAHRTIFRQGAYHPLKVMGEQAFHVCSYMRSYQNQHCLIVFPRFLTGLKFEPGHLPIGEPVWNQTWLNIPSDLGIETWRNVYTQQPLTLQKHSNMIDLPISMIFQHFPFALLEPVL